MSLSRFITYIIIREKHSILNSARKGIFTLALFVQTLSVANVPVRHSPEELRIDRSNIGIPVRGFPAQLGAWRGLVGDRSRILGSKCWARGRNCNQFLLGRRTGLFFFPYILAPTLFLWTVTSHSITLCSPQTSPTTDCSLCVCLSFGASISS